MNKKAIYKELEEYNKTAIQGGGLSAIERQHNSGKLTARERINILLDTGTFVELDKFKIHQCHELGMDNKHILGDGVVAGYGKIDNRQVFVYAYDFTAYGGSLSESNASKIVKVQKLAL